MVSIPYALDQSQDLITQWIFHMSLGVYIILCIVYIQVTLKDVLFLVNCKVDL